jgi:uncharacterized phage infection (PIP) family protein YhgE
MSAPTSAPVADEKSLPVKSALEEFPAQIEGDTERTKSSLARLTSNSIDRLERLMSEIQEMREFLISEGERVQREIANYAQLNQNVALAATKIKAETVGTWKGAAVAGDTHSGAKQLSNGREKLKRWPAP